MADDDSEQVRVLFAASSRDLTPAPVRHLVQVLYAPVSDDREVTRRCALLLSDSELRRADRLSTQAGQALFKQRRAFRRFCAAVALETSRPLSQIDFQETQTGRPQLTDFPSLWFSFSSCRLGFLGAWSSAHGIGVDFEDQARDLEVAVIARHFFSVAEAKAVTAANGPAARWTFLQLWSLKEAALKSIGEGLPFGLDRFEFELGQNPRVVHAPSDYGGAAQFDPRIIEGTGGCAALVIRNRT
jgi:4'-phosphopantetheinyl transferase